MPGLNLGVGGNVRARAQAYAGNSPPPTTATQAAYGVAFAPSAGVATLLPNNPAGMAATIGFIGLGLLALLYWSLPG